MISLQQSPKVISRPCEVYWQGWKSTTSSLQQAGWQISVEEDINEQYCRLAIHHPIAKLTGFAREVQHHYYPVSDYRDLPIFIIERMASSFHVSHAYLEKFKPVNCTPSFIEIGSQTEYIDAVRLFRPIQDPKELIIDPNRISEILEKIQEAQLPEQAQIRERARRRAANEAFEYGQVHGQIITLKAA